MYKNIFCPEIVALKIQNKVASNGYRTAVMKS
jgi:hypothetical protein